MKSFFHFLLVSLQVLVMIAAAADFFAFHTQNWLIDVSMFCYASYVALNETVNNDDRYE